MKIMENISIYCFFCRLPQLFDVLCAVAVPQFGCFKADMIAPMAACYSILMKMKFSNLSAFHRLSTAITTKGGLDERVCNFVIYNHV